MLTLKEQTWKPFTIEDLFYVKGSKTTPLNKLKETGKGKYPYVTTQSTNNGVANYFNYSTEIGNVLTVDSAVAGFCSYQEFNFSASDHVEKLIPKFNLTKSLAKFLALMVNCNQEKFSYGYKASQTRLKRQQIILPINDKGDPDWVFMENYVDKLENAQKEKYKAFALKKLENLEYKEIPKLNEKTWKTFFISDIFTIGSGKRLTKMQMKVGKIPFIGSTDSNNGITNWVSNINETYDKNVLGVNYNGSVVENFFHGYNCIFSDDVKRLHLRHHKDNKYILLFFKSIILQQKSKYTYGYKFKASRMSRQLIMVPVNPFNEPDYDYMEQYIKNAMYKKLRSYLEMCD